MLPKISIAALIASTVLTLGPVAFADDFADPAMFQDGSNCANSWCASTKVGVDPNTGDYTLEFVMKDTFTTGWVKLTGNGGFDLLDFVNNGGTYEIFLYCGTTDCSPEDVGLPPGISVAAGDTYPAFKFTPASAVNAGFTTDLNGTRSLDTYQILDQGPKVSGVGVAAVPEPTSIFLFGSALALSAAAIRRRLARS